MSYDLAGCNDHLALNNWAMYRLIELMQNESKFAYKRLWKKFSDNSGRWVDQRNCTILLWLAREAHANCKVDSDRQLLERLMGFLHNEIGADHGGFRVE